MPVMILISQTIELRELREANSRKLIAMFRASSQTLSAPSNQSVHLFSPLFCLRTGVQPTPANAAPVAKMKSRRLCSWISPQEMGNQILRAAGAQCKKL